VKPLLVGRSYELLFSPDERTAIALGPALVLWDLESRGREVIGRPFRYLAHAALSPDGARLAVVNTSGKLAMLDARTLTAVWQADFGFGEGSNLVWLADGSAFVVGSWDGTIAIVERDEPKLRARDDAPNRMVRRFDEVLSA
jgi:WD40 repeat protein